MFKSLALTATPRTRPSLVIGEFGGVLAARDYREFAANVRAAVPRLEGLGIFEPGTVSVYLERPPKLLVETVGRARVGGSLSCRGDATSSRGISNGKKKKMLISMPPCSAPGLLCARARS